MYNFACHMIWPLPSMANLRFAINQLIDADRLKWILRY